MPAPYRQVSQVESYEARVRTGLLRLEIAPRHVLLELEGKLSMSIHEQFLTWIERSAERRRWQVWRKKEQKSRKRSLRLGEGRLLVARSHLTEELSLWYEEKAHRYRRLVGIEPVILLDAAALRSWKALDQLSKRLAAATDKYAHEALSVSEYGRGQHRVVLVEYKDHYEVLARPVFKERHRPVFQVHRDGTVINMKGKGQKGVCVSRYSVTIGNDRIRFDQVDGNRAADLHLPWISPEDRGEMANRFRLLVDGAHSRPRAETEIDDSKAEAGEESPALTTSEAPV